ncbi:MAG TPA: GyrI-like domain-containing protein, partial [Sphingomonas sp.]|nr:GyrI-like domain-containing protein [Sphingomonas sp.]
MADVPVNGPPGIKRLGKVDLKREMAPLYSPPPGQFVVIDIPPLRYLMIDGAGDPNCSPDYGAAVETLYAASYAVKFASKRVLGRDYVVPPLEGLWWAPDMRAFLDRRKSEWMWTMMICVPDFVGDQIVGQALGDVARKKPALSFEKVRLSPLEEKRAVQILHVGSYDDEAPVLRKLHDEFLPAHRLRPTGKHHEIYLSDPRRIEASRLKTILR